jgi:hypothetical protein
MVFPIVVPHIPFDGYLSANFAIALTGMGVDMGQDLCMDFDSTALFDNETIKSMNGLYLAGQMALHELEESLKTYAANMPYAFGFKLSCGLELLLFYRRVFPEMTLIKPILDWDAAEEEIIDKCIESGNDIIDLTVPQLLRIQESESRAVERAVRKIQSLHIPAEMFNTPETRSRALVRMAEWVGGKREGGEVGKMVDNAQRKLHFVYDEGEKRARNRQQRKESTPAPADDDGENEDRAAPKARGRRRNTAV